ncbi:MAG TPA: YeeE/YedE family protein [Quisquiliibacterium sp.]|nr:YeeE/YedE family protein [Quisquiliibacterium sp.]HQN13154.1 YeeE/YedE family protein [Quisquiliibacterium sp.]HQP65093.1 YeeE/YedE family protein [Quisquiliibacterium sp.]
MTDVDIPALQSAVAWAAFALCFALGAVMRRTGFCTMGALADIVNIGDWTRMRMWICAIGVAMLGTQLLAATGLIDLDTSVYTAARFPWLSYVLGGLLFGFGMVLASGCGSKTLVRIGGGSLKSLVVFCVMGLFAYMTLRGVFGVARVAVVDPVAFTLAPGQDLPRLLAGADGTGVDRIRLIAGGIVGLALIGFAFAHREFRSPDAILGGVGVGLAIVGAWYISGHLGYVAEDPTTLEEKFVGTNSGRIESLSFVAPVAFTLDLLMFWSDTSRHVTLGVAAVAGMIAGAFAHAVASRQFRWEGFRDVEDTANHLVGAACMGVGGVTALGCTIGQGLSGLSTLALGSVLAFAALLAGGMAGLKYQTWRVERLV